MLDNVGTHCGEVYPAPAQVSGVGVSILPPPGRRCDVCVDAPAVVGEPIPESLLDVEHQRTIFRCVTCQRAYVRNGRTGDRSLEQIERHRERLARAAIRQSLGLARKRTGRKPWWMA